MGVAGTNFYGSESLGTAQEGKLTRTVELQTSKIPSIMFLGAAGVSIVASLAFKLAGQGKTANFIGQWAPTILLLGIYNKIVKEEGPQGSALITP